MRFASLWAVYAIEKSPMLYADVLWNLFILSSNNRSPHVTLMLFHREAEE